MCMQLIRASLESDISRYGKKNPIDNYCQVHMLVIIFIECTPYISKCLPVSSNYCTPVRPVGLTNLFPLCQVMGISR